MAHTFNPSTQEVKAVGAYEFGDILVYKLSFRTGRAVSENKTNLRWGKSSLKDILGNSNHVSWGNVNKIAVSCQCEPVGMAKLQT